MQDRRALLSESLDKRMMALQLLEKALSERKTILEEIEGWYRWGYTQLMQFRKMGQSTDENHQFNEELLGITREMEPTDRQPDAKLIKLRQVLIEQANEMMEDLQQRMREALVA